MSKKLLKKRVSKLLDLKSNDYKRKYFLLSKISETNISFCKKNFNKFECYIRSLNESGGKFPVSTAILDLYENQILLEKS